MFLKKLFAPKIKFSDRFNSLVEKHNLSEADMADMFETSRTTIRRWREGKSEPHEMVQRIVWRAFEKL